MRQKILSRRFLQVWELLVTHDVSGLERVAKIQAIDPGTRRYGLAAAAVSGVLGVGFGAFAAHGLSQLGNPQIVDWVKTGASYQLWHAAAILGLVGASGLLPRRWSMRLIHCFFGGSLIFAGSLYALALLQWRWLGAITPIGGVLMILGWVLLGVIGWRQAGQSGEDA
jgi:uncharacterized membrane protein YgdD (TMEM256/DUF423 family)